MKVNIISTSNGVGLTRDIGIIRNLVEELGHTTEFFDHYLILKKEHHPTYADLTIFIELFNVSATRNSRNNILIPNPEWFDMRWRGALPKMRSVLCKTKTALSTFSLHARNCKYTSFTSEDRFNTEIAKDFSKCVHIAGKSCQKGTDMVFETWRQNPDLPHLVILQDEFRKKHRDQLPNVTYIYDRLSEEKLMKLQNECGIHICPSETEGFGHYIVEGMSTAGVVLTTDAPPMNELVTIDRGFLCQYGDKRKQNMAQNYYVTSQTLADKVREISRIPHESLRQIGLNARKFFLENDNFFKTTFKQIVNDSLVIPPPRPPTLRPALIERRGRLR